MLHSVGQYQVLQQELVRLRPDRSHPPQLQKRRRQEQGTVAPCGDST